MTKAVAESTLTLYRQRENTTTTAPTPTPYGIGFTPNQYAGPGNGMYGF